MSTAIRLGPNDVLPCRTESARRRHLAAGRVCLVCEPDAETSAHCPACDQKVIVVGERFERHDVEGTGWVCMESGAVRRLPLGRAA